MQSQTGVLQRVGQGMQPLGQSAGLRRVPVKAQSGRNAVVLSAMPAQAAACSSSQAAHCTAASGHNSRRILQQSRNLLQGHVCASVCRQLHNSENTQQRFIATAAAQADAAAPAAAPKQQQQDLRGKDVVMRFYEAYNERDIDTIASLIADDISYHDLVYEDPHEGREGVMEWLNKIRKYAPDDLKFVIEDITEGDPHKVGVMWHVECGDGIFFPFSRGCSFITLSQDGRKIQTVRDIVEPAMKPGDSTLQLLGTLTPLIRRLGPGGADPARLKTLPIASAAVWALYVGYISTVMFSTAIPGAAAWAQPPEVFDELFKESINIWWINEALANIGLSPIPVMPCKPVSEAVFNFVLAWAGMFLPIILTDGPSQKVEKKGLWFTGIMFLTNVFFIPFMALRAKPEPAAAGAAGGSSSSSSKLRQRKVAAPGSQQLPGWAPAIGAVGGFLGVFSIYWALAGRPELGGDLAARWTYLQDTLNSNRVFWAFWFDMVLFYTFQVTMMQAAPAQYKYVPYFGMVGWLLAGGSKSDSSSSSR